MEHSRTSWKIMLHCQMFSNRTLSCVTLSYRTMICRPLEVKCISKPWRLLELIEIICHGTPCPHAPNHLWSSLTPSTYTLVSLRCTLCKLAQPHHSCGWTKLRSMSNFPGLSPYVSGCCLFVFFSICRLVNQFLVVLLDRPIVAMLGV